VGTGGLPVEVPTWTRYGTWTSSFRGGSLTPLSNSVQCVTVKGYLHVPKWRLCSRLEVVRLI